MLVFITSPQQIYLGVFVTKIFFCQTLFCLAGHSNLLCRKISVTDFEGLPNHFYKKITFFVTWNCNERCIYVASVYGYIALAFTFSEIGVIFDRSRPKAERWFVINKANIFSKVTFTKFICFNLYHFYEKMYLRHSNRKYL
jgi:hypothetical protein